MKKSGGVGIKGNSELTVKVRAHTHARVRM
jgi:hypothetical protein